MGKPKQKLKEKNQEQYEEESEYSDEQSEDSAQQGSEKIQSLSGSQGQDQKSEESKPVEAAIKTMKFREKRGSKMKDLIKGKIEKDQFWQKNKVYFGGDLRGKDQDQHESEYQASSSGRDQFDSDFDLTDSYPGKRGRKKGQKMKKKIKRDGQTRPRGRPKKEKSQKPKQQSPQSSQQKIAQTVEKKKKIYKQIPSKPNDAYIVYICLNQKKKSSKTAKEQKKSQECHQKPNAASQRKQGEQIEQE